MIDMCPAFTRRHASWCAERSESESAASSRAKATLAVAEHPGTPADDIVAHDLGGGQEAEPLQTPHQAAEGTCQRDAQAILDWSQKMHMSVRYFFPHLGSETDGGWHDAGRY